jgi:hypothetical protein
MSKTTRRRGMSTRSRHSFGHSGHHMRDIPPQRSLCDDLLPVLCI